MPEWLVVVIAIIVGVNAGVWWTLAAVALAKRYEPEPAIVSYRPEEFAQLKTLKGRIENGGYNDDR